MRFANNIDLERIEVTKSGEVGICPICKSKVIGKKGRIKIAHWSHMKMPDCDKWHDPITEWHLNWQNQFPLDCQENTITDFDTKISHRADILLKNGLVIEVQNSPISISEIEDRERFYGKNNMIWIINGSNLASHCKISYQYIERKFIIKIKIPKTLEYFPDYKMDDFKRNFLKAKSILRFLESKKLKNFDVNDGCNFSFEFYDGDKLYEDKLDVISDLKEVIIQLYDYNLYADFDEDFDEEFIVTLYENDANRFTDIILEKRYWRTFIDNCNFPVFFDNLTGLDQEHLYWYQKNKIVQKKSFIEKYLQYT